MLKLFATLSTDVIFVGVQSNLPDILGYGDNSSFANVYELQPFTIQATHFEWLDFFHGFVFIFKPIALTFGVLNRRHPTLR